MTLGALRIGLFLVLSSACATQATPARDARTEQTARVEIDRVLDDFHAAAARADESAYFSAFSRQGIFLGTDATERWDVAAFRAYVHPYFAQGRGYTYVPRARHVLVHEAAQVAWFDELLDNEKYGQVRGSGVLVREAGAWKIAQYNLTFTIPNEKAKAVVEILRLASDAPSP